MTFEAMAKPGHDFVSHGGGGPFQGMQVPQRIFEAVVRIGGERKVPLPQSIHHIRII